MKVVGAPARTGGFRVERGKLWGLLGEGSFRAEAVTRAKEQAGPARASE